MNICHKISNRYSLYSMMSVVVLFAYAVKLKMILSYLVNAMKKMLGKFCLTVRKFVPVFG